MNDHGVSRSSHVISSACVTRSIKYIFRNADVILMSISSRLSLHGVHSRNRARLRVRRVWVAVVVVALMACVPSTAFAEGDVPASAEPIGSSNGTSALTSVSVSTPADTRRGDLLIASVARSASGMSLVPPGWKRVIATTATPDLRTTVFWRRAEQDGEKAYSFVATTVSPVAAEIAVYRGAGVIDSPKGQIGSETSVPQVALTTKRAGDLVHVVFSHASQSMLDFAFDMQFPGTVNASGFQAVTDSSPSVSVISGRSNQGFESAGMVSDATPLTLLKAASKTVGIGMLVSADSTPAVGAFGKAIVDNAYVSGTFSVQGTATDTESKIARVTVTYSGPSSGTVCEVTTGARAFKCPWNTLSMTPGTYTLRLEVQDNARNTPHVVTRTVEVGPPRATLGKLPFKRLTGSEYQVASGTSLYFNPSQAGSFRMSIKASAKEAKVTQVQFPAPPSGWTISAAADTVAPYEAVYSWAAGAASPGEMAVVAQTDKGGYSTFPYTVVADATPPTAPTPIVTVMTGGIKASIVLGASTDAGAGSLLRQLQRRTSSVSSGVCGTYGEWTTVSAAASVGTIVNTLPTGSGCAEYRMLLADKLGNEGFVIADKPAKFGPDSVVPDLSPPSASISTIATILTGSATISGTASDDSKVESLALSYTGPAAGTICSLTVVSANWSCPWDTSALADGAYTVKVDVVDLASKKTTVTATATIDRQGPTASFAGIDVVSGGSFVAAVPGTNTVAFNPQQPVSFKVRVNAENVGGSIASVMFPAPGQGWTPASPTADSTPPAPYEMTYTYAGGTGASPGGTLNIVVTDNAGRTTNVPLVLTSDVAPPTGSSLSYANGWSNAVSASITLNPGSDAGSGIGDIKLERSVASNTSGACETFGQFNVVATSPVSPYADTTIASANCYRYRLIITDRVGNATTVNPGTTLKVDTVAPTGTISFSPTSPFSDHETLSGTSSDSLSGVQKVDVKYSSVGNGSPTNGTICTTSQIYWTCEWNTAVLPDGSYTILLEVVDQAGNANSWMISRNVVLDNSGPVASLAGFSEVSGGQFTHAPPGGSVMFYNPQGSASFTVLVNAQDAGSGMDRVQFPAPGAGWTPAAPANDSTAPSPYEATYGFMTPAGNSPGVLTALAFDSGGKSTPVTFTLTKDEELPVGGSVMYADTPTKSMSVPISITSPTDALSGVGSVVLERRVANYSNKTCGTFGPFVILMSSPAATYTDNAVIGGSCYEYRLAVRDHVDNYRPFSSPNTVRVDTAAPTGTISSTPMGPVGGIATLSGTAEDTHSGVASVKLAYSLGATSGTICTLSTLTAGGWSCPWSTGGLPKGTYTLMLEVTDAAGNREAAPVSRTIQVV